MGTTSQTAEASEAHFRVPPLRNGALSYPPPGGEERGERHARAGAEEEPEYEGWFALREQVAEDEEDRKRPEQEARQAHERERRRRRKQRKQDDDVRVERESSRQHYEAEAYEDQEE